MRRAAADTNSLTTLLESTATDPNSSAFTRFDEKEGKTAALKQSIPPAAPQDESSTSQANWLDLSLSVPKVPMRTGHHRIHTVPSNPTTAPLAPPPIDKTDDSPRARSPSTSTENPMSDSAQIDALLTKARRHIQRVATPTGDYDSSDPATEDEAFVPK